MWISLEEGSEIMGLSQLSEKCRKCPFVDECDYKQIEALAYLPEPQVAMDVAQSAGIDDTRKIFANEYIADRNAWYPSEGFKEGIEHIQEEIVTVLRRILPDSLLESIFDVKPEDVHRKQ